MTVAKGLDREVEHERRGIFNATTIFLVTCVTTPVLSLSNNTGQTASRAFDKGECNGVWQERIRKAPSCSTKIKRLCCGSNPPCALVMTAL